MAVAPTLAYPVVVILTAPAAATFITATPLVVVPSVLAVLVALMVCVTEALVTESV